MFQYIKRQKRHLVDCREQQILSPTAHGSGRWCRIRWPALTLRRRPLGAGLMAEGPAFPGSSSGSSFLATVRYLHQSTDQKSIFHCHWGKQAREHRKSSILPFVCFQQNESCFLMANDTHAEAFGLGWAAEKATLWVVSFS